MLQIDVVIDHVQSEQERKATEALQKAGITGPPVNPIAVAEALGYDVYWNRFANTRVHGAVELVDGKIRIDVEERDTVNRRRFTIAHEVGHALNHMTKRDSAGLTDGEYAGHYRTDFDPETHSPLEIEANSFAGSLLMPAEWIRQYWNKTPSVSALAKTFRVSEQAMEIRLKTLGIYH